MATFARFPPRLQEAIVARLGWSSLRPVQEEAGAAILDGHNAVVLAPTAGGKTEAAMFPILANLIERPCDGVGAVYIAPIKALLNNQRERLGVYTEMVGLDRFVWHGDVTASAKKAFCRDPAELLMTTPESLEVMLLSSRVPVARLFRDLRFVVIDEVHALAGTDRGAHLMSVFERLLRLTGNDVQRIGLSATVGNPDAIVGWLAGSSAREGVVIDPPKPAQKRRVSVRHLPSVAEIAAAAAQLGSGQKSLFFCQSRALAESVAQNMRGRSIDVFVHHSSVSLEERQEAEERFHGGSDVAIVCTSTLELGIDVGDLDRVFQANAASTVSSFLQRMGRTGRRGDTPANTTFFCEHRESILCAVALVELARDKWVESVPPQKRCWPVLVHQLLALTMQFGGLGVERCWEQLARVPDFSEITREEFDRLVAFMLERDYLFESGGLLAMGDRAERVYGRRNFMEMYAVFSSPIYYSVVADGGKSIGSLDQEFVDRLVEEMSSFLLGGRAWTVAAINHGDRVIQVRPAPGGKRPSWGGFVPQFLGFEICQRIRETLVSDDAIPYLDPDAADALEAERVDLGPLLRNTRYSIRFHDDVAEWWTFAGGRINHTLRYALQYATGWRVVPNNLSLRIDGAGVSHESLRETLGYISDPSFWDSPEVGRAIVDALPEYRLSKFQQALPPRYARETVARLLLDHAGTRAFLRELAGDEDGPSGLTRPPARSPTELPWRPPARPSPTKALLEAFGDYDLIEKLSGGMSESFVARHRISGDTVFLKRVMQSDKWDAAALERELRIYEKLQRFESNAILAVRDVSRAGGYITLVTELADGGDLADHVEEQPAGCLTPKETKAIALEVGTAIQALHESDIIHRDLKPENILRSGGAWKLTDFGIAKNLVRLQTLQTFQMAGTPGYTAPEQFDGAEARASADIYSFGKIITFLLIGLTDADQIRFPSWRRVVQRCLARDPDQRSSLAAILTEIEAIAV